MKQVRENAEESILENYLRIKSQHEMNAINNALEKK